MIKGSQKGILHFKLKDTSGLPIYSNIENIEIDNFESRWIMHPDTSVDLAVLPIASLLRNYKKIGKELFTASLYEENIPNDSIRNTLSAIEEVLMIGYPFGLRDQKNDLPVTRRGLTATPPFLNYNSIPEFLIDAPVYPGSSGSPVVIFNPGTYISNKGGIFLKGRLLLLGINYATYTKDFEGKLIPRMAFNIEDSVVTSTPIPYNIGIVIKAERLLEFKKILLR